MGVDTSQRLKDRVMYAAMGSIYPHEGSFQVTQESTEGIPCYWLQPENPMPNELVVYIRGGG